MKKIVYLIVFLFAQVVISQEICCPHDSPSAVGISFASGGVPLLSGRFWLSSRLAIEVGLAEPPIFSWLYASGLGVIHDYCNFRAYLQVGASTALKSDFWWISSEFGVGVEWCPPVFKHFSISIAGGPALTYCLCCLHCDDLGCHWQFCWQRTIWFIFSIHYYFPTKINAYQ